MRKLRRPSLVLLALALTILYGCVSLERHQVCGPPPCLHGIIPTVLTPYCCATGIDVHRNLCRSAVSSSPISSDSVWAAF